MSEKTPKTITNDESVKLLEFSLHQRGFVTSKKRKIRNYTMVVFMLDAGLRVGELVQLRQASLWLNNEPVNALFVDAKITKTHASRTVPLTERAKEAIRWIRLSYWKIDSEQRGIFAFYDFDDSKHIGVRQVQKIIGHASLLSFGRTITPHILRHTFATRMMRITSTPVVQELLGHKSLTSTQVYTHPNGDDLQKAIAGLNS